MRRETFKDRIRAIVAPTCDSTNARLLTQRAAYQRGDTVILTTQDSTLQIWQRDGIFHLSRTTPRGATDARDEKFAAIAMAELGAANDSNQKGSDV
jgi:hypothetical protein